MTKEWEHTLYKKLPDVLLPWYDKNARDLPWRKTKEPYPVWLSEIMLQQTRVEAVKDYYLRFLRVLPNVKALAEVSEEKLLKLWEGLGYYNRARNLQKAAKWIVTENNGVFPSEYSEILTLPGVGQYTAGAILSICFNEPVAAVDGNVLRIISRITEDQSDIEKTETKKRIKTRLQAVYPKDRCGDFTQSLMELGAVICVPNGTPGCNICPAQSLCQACKNGTWKDLPLKEKKKKRKVQEKTVYLLYNEGTIAIKKRPDKGLLANMWELPNTDGVLTPEEAFTQADSWDCAPAAIEQKLIRHHVFTHVEWHMTCYVLFCSNRNKRFIWADEKKINETIPLPSAFRQFIGDR